MYFCLCFCSKTAARITTTNKRVKPKKLPRFTAPSTSTTRNIFDKKSTDKHFLQFHFEILKTHQFHFETTYKPLI